MENTIKLYGNKVYGITVSSILGIVYGRALFYLKGEI